MRNKTQLKVTSHVGRDLLQSAASFKTDYSVVWEYVVNSVQYVDEGVLPKVHLVTKAREREILISDNGRGMTTKDLERFFTMHAENIDRLRGRPGRGKFGTGKSAAFGIGESLTVDTRRDGKRNVVRLTRKSIDVSSGEDIPVEWLIKNEETALPNGTTVTISAIALPKINTQAIIEYIERHLQAFRSRLPEVAVNDHVCQYREPQVVDTLVFRPTTEQAKILGDVSLSVKISPSPLAESEVGIAVTAGTGNFVAVETGGVDRKELGSYLFGEIDVPALETFKSSIEPYGTSRSLQLNPQHPVCSVLIPFIGSKLEEVRQTQLRKLNAARKTEQARRLSAEAEKIANLLNKDFQNVMSKLDGIRAVAACPGSAGARFGSGSGNNEEGTWVEGTREPGDIEKSESLGNPGLRTGRQVPNVAKAGKPNDSGNAAVDPAGGEGKRMRPRGGFRVDYRELGEHEDRSKYDRTTLTILINLDHPAVKNALRSAGIEDPVFKRLSYEIAFTEYSVALGYEMAERDPDIPADDLLYEVRSTLNRVAASAAALYA
jgi:Histidine kinase-, DNA gyrase B-, and HSP90-like ATPase